MTKLRNKIVLVLLALCIVACLGITVACGGDNDGKTDNKPVTYTVTVKADNEAVKGVGVTVNKKGGLSLGNKTTDENGKVEFSLAKSDDYTVELDSLPENYEVPEGASLSFPADRNLTVNLAEKFAYKVNLVNPDGSPFTAEGVSVGICIDGNCLTPVEIDENGLARIEAAKNDYHIKVFGLPNNYAYECDADGYSVYQNEDGTYVYEGTDNTYNSLSATKNEQTITIYPVNALDFAKMTALTQTEIEQKYNDQQRQITGANAYSVKMQIPAHETVYYTFTAEYTGNYMLYPIGYQSAAIGYKINPRFLLGNTSAEGSAYIDQNGQAIEAVKGQQYYINVTALASGLDCEFVIATPAATQNVITGATTVKASINKEGANAVIVLAPTAGATYKLTVQGNGAISRADNTQDAEGFVFEDTDYSDNASTTAKFTEDQIGDRLYFAVSVKAANYPVSIDVKVEKTADLANTYNVIKTEETLTQYTVPENKELVPIPLDEEVELVLANGVYHYGTADGPVVVVMLTEELDVDRFSVGGALAYIEYYTDGRVNPYVVDVTPFADRADLTKGKTYDDYREVLRGFKNYKYDNRNNMVIPNAADITVANYYTKYVNEEGVYPLTEELKGILETLTAQLSFDLLPDGNYENLWMFACYYYDDYMEPDVIVGEYKFVTKVEWGERISVGDQKEIGWDEENSESIYGSITANDYKLVVEKRYKYAIYELNEEGEYTKIDSGVWSKDEDNDVYTFAVHSWYDVVYSVAFNEAAGAILLVGDDDTEWEFAKNASQSDDEIVGEYADEEMGTTLIVNGNGTAVFGEGGQKWSGLWSKDDDLYYFTEYHPSFGKTEYMVVIDEGALYFYEIVDGEAGFEEIYTFTAVVELPDPDETLYTENGSAQLDLFYTDENSGTFVLYSCKGGNNTKLCAGTFTLTDDGLTVNVTEKESEVEQASAVYENGKITVTIKYVDIEGSAPFEFNMSSDEDSANTQD